MDVLIDSSRTLSRPNSAFKKVSSEVRKVSIEISNSNDNLVDDINNNESNQTNHLRSRSPQFIICNDKVNSSSSKINFDLNISSKSEIKLSGNGNTPFKDFNEIENMALKTVKEINLDAEKRKMNDLN